MKLFSEAVAWRANKQDMVTTSLTKAELLTISQIIKKLIYFSCLMIAFTLIIPKAFTINCDNIQTIWWVYEIVDKITSHWHSFSLIEVGSTMEINTYLLSAYKKDGNRWFEQGPLSYQPQDFYENDRDWGSNRPLHLYQEEERTERRFFI